MLFRRLNVTSLQCLAGGLSVEHGEPIAAPEPEMFGGALLFYFSLDLHARQFALQPLATLLQRFFLFAFCRTPRTFYLPPRKRDSETALRRCRRALSRKLDSSCYHFFHNLLNLNLLNLFGKTWRRGYRKTLAISHQENAAERTKARIAVKRGFNGKTSGMAPTSMPIRLKRSRIESQ